MMATAAKSVMAMVTMVAGYKEGNGNGVKTNGDGNEGGGKLN